MTMATKTAVVVTHQGEKGGRASAIKTAVSNALLSFMKKSTGRLRNLIHSASQTSATNEAKITLISVPQPKKRS
jgi:hypothetical protein